MRPGGKSSLRLVFWELTASCNLHCAHCRAEATPERLKEELSTEECFKFIDELSDFADPILILTGGEPLKRPDLFEIADRAVGRGLRAALASNGTLIDEDTARRIAEVGIARVAISIDGSNAKTHDAFRGIPGCFEKALEGARNTTAAGVELQLNTTVSKHNVGEVEDIFKLALDIGAKAMHIFMLVPVGCGATISEEQMLPAGQYEKVLNWLYEMGRKHDNIELKATCAPHYYRILHSRAAKEGRKVDIVTDGMAAVTKGCLAGASVCFVGRTGDVQPCGYLPLVAGNIRRQPFRNIWEKSELFLSLRDDSNLKGKCGACEYKSVCMGCRARAYGETGDYLAEEPYCAFIPKSMRNPEK